MCREVDNNSSLHALQAYDDRALFSLWPIGDLIIAVPLYSAQLKKLGYRFQFTIYCTEVNVPQEQSWLPYFQQP